MTLGNPDRPVGGLAVPRPEGIEIRPLARHDAMAALALAREHHHLGPSDDEAPRSAFDTIVGDADAVALLALAGTEPAGVLTFRFRRRLNHATFEGWVSDLFVREPLRGRGVGRALLDSAIAEWRLRGGHQVEVELRREQVAAFRLFEAAGFADLGTFYEIAPVRTRGIALQHGVEIRPIADDEDDFSEVTRLLAELGRPAPADERLPALRRTYAEHVGNPRTGSMLAFLDGRAVGFISLELRPRLHDGATEAWIPDLIVSEAARGRDIGAALLDAAFATALLRDATAAKLESGAQRAVAHRLYEAAGMVDVGSFLTLQR
jgi:GNAT superfamily N-acetyltransferase